MPGRNGEEGRAGLGRADGVVARDGGDLQQHRSSCLTCHHATSHFPEPITFTPPPEYPFQETVLSLLQLDLRQYIATTNRLTGWLEVAHFLHGTASGLTVTSLVGDS